MTYLLHWELAIITILNFSFQKYPPPMPNKKHTKKSVIVFAGQGLSQITRFLSNLLLAWYLLPDDFGVAAIVVTIIVGLSLLSDVGIVDCVIRHEKGDQPEFYKTAQWIMLFRGVGLYLILLGLAPLLESFYEKDNLALYLSWAGLCLVLDGFLSSRTFVLRREMQVVKITLLEIIPQLLTVIILVGLVTVYPSVWVLISAMNISMLIRVIMSQFMVPNLVKPADFDKKAAKAIISFGKWILLSTLFTFIIIQSDRLILAKLTTFSEVGIYHIALAISGVFFMVGIQLIDSIVYPAVCAVARQSDASKLKEEMEHALNGFLPLLFAMVLITFVASPLFFYYLYKPEYHSAGPVAQASVFVFLLMVVYFLYNKMIIALNRPDVAAKVSAIVAFLRVGLSIAGWQLGGLYGFITGLGLGSALGVVITYLWLKTQKDINYTGIIKATGVIGLMMFVYYIGRNMAVDKIMYEWVLMILTLIGVVYYLYSIYGIQAIALFKK